MCPARTAAWARAQTGQLLPTPVGPVRIRLWPAATHPPEAREATAGRSRPPGGAPVDVLGDGGGVAQLGRFEPGGDPAGVSGVGFSLDEQAEAVGEVQAGPRPAGVVELVGEPGGHGRQAELGELGDGGVGEHHAPAPAATSAAATSPAAESAAAVASAGSAPPSAQ